MTHPADWRCRSCRFVLGQVRDGVLRPLVAVASVDRRGVARVRCPGCAAVRQWFPSDSVAAVAGDRGSASRPG